MCSEAFLQCLYKNTHQTERVMVQSLGYRKIARVKTFWSSTHPHITVGKKDDGSRFAAMNLLPGWLIKCLADQHSDTLCWLSHPSTFTALQLAWPLKKSWVISLGYFYIWVRVEYLHSFRNFQDRLSLLGLLKLLIYFRKVFKIDLYSLAKFASSPLNSTVVPVRFVDLSLCLQLCI